MTAQPAEHAGTPKPGDVLGGKYQVEGVVAIGGMGIVLAARHLYLRQRVAMKLLLPETAKQPEAAARFLREAQAAAAIQSEHVARVIDVGTLPDGAPFMVMEFLAGHDFGKLLKTRGPLVIDQAVDFILQAGEAVAEAHAMGIVHRDLKPGNLFLTSRPDGSPLVKVLDFGLSKASSTGAIDGNLTSTSLVVGSSYYMAPEQFRGLRYADARTDIWALGVILFHLISGRRPFEGDSFGAVCASVSVDPPLSLRELRPDASPALEAVLFRCLEKDRARRVQTMAELAHLLAPFGSPRSMLSVERIGRLIGDPVPLASDIAPYSSVTPGPVSGRSPITTVTPISAPAPLSSSERHSIPPPLSSSNPLSTPIPNALSGSNPLSGSGLISAPGPDPARASLHSIAPGDVSGAEGSRSNTGRENAWGHTRVHQRGRGTTLLIAGGAAVVFLGIVIVSITRFTSGEGTASSTTATAHAAPPEPPPVVPAALSPVAVDPSPPASAELPGADAPTAAPTSSSKTPKRRPKPASGDALDRWN